MSGPASRSACHFRRGSEDVLEVVEHEEHVLRAEQPLDALAAELVDVECCRDRRQDERSVGDGRQLDERRPVSELRLELPGDGQCEPRLARSAGAGQRDEPFAFPHERDDRGHVVDPPDQRGRRRGERRGRPVRERGGGNS